MKVLLCILALSLSLSACAKQRPPARPEGPEVALTREAFRVLTSLKEAYEQRALKAMAPYCTQEVFEQIKAGLREFDSAALSFSPRWVEVESLNPPLLVVNVAWRGTWQRKGRSLSEEGMAVFQLRGSPLRVSRIFKGSPFVHPQ